MRMYFIRHAPTENNLSGTMNQHYDECPIIDFDLNEWISKVGCHISYPDDCGIFANQPRNYSGELNYGFCCVFSPTLRCRQTADKLFNLTFAETNLVSEFDCSGLGNRKFWDISKEEFEKLVPLTAEQMKNRIETMLIRMMDIEQLCNKHSAIIVSHGMYIRYLYHWLNGNCYISPYDVINSKGFTFGNLDMLYYDTDTKTVEVYRYKEPIKHA